jgi:hypothetical protein
MAPPNPNEIVHAIKDAITGIVDKDAVTIRGFSERQLKMLAQQATWIAEATLAGEFKTDPHLRDDFLDNLQDMAKDFVNTLRGLLTITVEKVLNAIVDVLWKAIESAIGFALPRPL